MLRLVTLGGLSLTDASGAPVAAQRRRLALLALLAPYGERGVTREKLVGYLWPEHPPERARHALEQLVYYLRRQVGERLFLGPDPLRLDPVTVGVDVQEFERAVAGGDLFDDPRRHGATGHVLVLLPGRARPGAGTPAVADDLTKGDPQAFGRGSGQAHGEPGVVEAGPVGVVGHDQRGRPFGIGRHPVGDALHHVGRVEVRSCRRCRTDRSVRVRRDGVAQRQPDGAGEGGEGQDDDHSCGDPGGSRRNGIIAPTRTRRTGRTVLWA